LQSAIDKNKNLEEQLQQQHEQHLQHQQQQTNKIAVLESSLAAADLSARNSSATAATARSSHNLTQIQLQVSYLVFTADFQ
jgi:hypothetical protein